MWMAKATTTLLLLLLVGLASAGLGVLAWLQDAQAQPARLPRPQAPGGQNRERELEEVERQLKELQEQLQAKQRQLARLREGDALAQIEAALSMLKQAHADDAQRGAAVAEFEQAFGRLKRALAGRSTPDPRSDPAAAPRDERLGAGGFFSTGIVDDGRVLRVDAEKKQVLLSAGSNDGVRKGQLYRVYQGGKPSPDQTGWIRVTQVEARWSVATLLQDFAPRAALKPDDFIQLHDGKEPEGLGEDRPRP
jgi:hypothetical protein